MRRGFLPVAAAALLAIPVAGCGEAETGPVRVGAIGDPPELRNPNLVPLDAPSAFLVEAAAQGLVRFDAAGEIEPALAQSWIVSDDGRRYTFRIRRARWSDGSRVTAQQVAARLRAAISRASRNRLKPVLGAIDDVVAMTDQVLEISLAGPRTNLLQLLAQPELGIILRGRGTGPFGSDRQEEVVRLSLPVSDEETEAETPERPDILLRGGSGAINVARFTDGDTDLVLGGTLGDLPLVRAADAPGSRLVFDPAEGLFGLAFTTAEGPLADPEVREAMSMAIDRQALATDLGVSGLRIRFMLLPPPTGGAQSGVPTWASRPLAARREVAGRTLAGLDEPLRIRVALPPGPGYRLLFARLRRDWRLIGIDAEPVEAGDRADLRLVDEVAPAVLASWYLRHFTCDASAVCDEAADAALEAARNAPTTTERRRQLISANRILSGITPFIPLAAPIRWSMVSPRLTGFRPNVFARHPAGTLIAEE